MTAILAGLYAGSVLLANLLTERFGLVSIGLGLAVTAGTFAAGVTLLSRNLLQDRIGRLCVLPLMVAGVLLSWILATPALAVASAVAFALSESADMLVYSRIRKRGASRALLAAGLAGGLVDTVAFLAIAGFPVTASSVAGQLVVKFGISALVVAARAARYCKHVRPALRVAQ